jgi:hypothetical protein
VKKRAVVAAFVLFLYDCVRLGLVLGLTKDPSGVPLAAANALFPAAGFFLFAGPQKYREYGPLYVAGKAVGVFAGLVWLFFTLKDGLRFPLSPLVKTNYMVFSLIILTFADTLSLLVRLLLDKAARKAAPLPPTRPSPQQLPPEQPAQPTPPFESTGDIA